MTYFGCLTPFVFFAFMVPGRCQATNRETVSKDTGKLRLVGGTNTSANVGLLQIRMGNGEFGSVCGLNLEAADVVCRQLGYDFGSVSSSPCGSYGGSHLCGAAGMPVAMKDLKCKGGELDIQDCSWDVSGSSCSGHALDSIVYCGTDGSAGNAEDGALRLLSHDGSPSIDGEGRLEMLKAGRWAPVCSSGFTDGAAVVACKSMGFTGATSPAVQPGCRSFKGKNFCGKVPPHVSKLACSGQETSIDACPYEEGDDVFCAPEESVMISCAGEGDSQGRQTTVPAPRANA